MSETVVTLLRQFKKLSAREKSEFLAESVSPTGDYGDWSDDDAVLFAAQSFACLDAEEAADIENGLRDWLCLSISGELESDRLSNTFIQGDRRLPID